MCQNFTSSHLFTNNKSPLRIFLLRKSCKCSISYLTFGRVTPHIVVKNIMRFGCVYKRTFHTSFSLVPNKGINNKDQVKHQLKNNKFSIMNNNTY